jgi:hypothetical protein|tara:strand:+ start:298 stop:780 length:483 start_codon:yes stop_codon:yes gene_type:complete
MTTSLIIDGVVENPLSLSWQQLRDLDGRWQCADIGSLVPGREGEAVTLAGLIELVQLHPDVDYLGLHAASDNFHASIPLEEIVDRGLLVHSINAQPIDPAGGGPFRFYIKDFASCQAAEVDECANVKFLDRMEFTIGKGHDNRPEDEESHQALHDHEEDS